MALWILVLLGCVAEKPGATSESPEDTPTDEAAEGEDEDDDFIVTPPGESPDGTIMFGLANMPGHGYRGEIIEIDRDGEVVWQYTLPESINPGEPGRHDRLFDVEPNEDGTVLFSVSGMGFYRVNRDGEIIWELADPLASHDVDMLRNGNILATHAGAAFGEPLVVEYNPEGEVVWSWDGVDFFTHPLQMDFIDETGAWAHANAVRKQVNGNIRICIRNFNVVVEVARSGAVVKAIWFDGTGDSQSVTIGPAGWIIGSRPHEVSKRRDLDRYSVALRRPPRVVEFDRTSGLIYRQWRAPRGDPSMARIRDHNRLPGGNWLITTSEHILEVNGKGKTIWQYTVEKPEAFAEYPNLSSLYKAVFINENGKVFGN